MQARKNWQLNKKYNEISEDSIWWLIPSCCICRKLLGHPIAWSCLHRLQMVPCGRDSDKNRQRQTTIMGHVLILAPLMDDTATKDADFFPGGSPLGHTPPSLAAANCDPLAMEKAFICPDASAKMYSRHFWTKFSQTVRFPWPTK